MPINYRKDKQGCYVQWGNHGKKYHYECGNKDARERARRKALKQAMAAHANGFKGD